jgi:LysR family transcriptional regulator, glycine cleavage system transcriptional activator
VSSQGVALARSRLVGEHLSSGCLVMPFDISVPAQSSYFAVYVANRLPRAEVAVLLGWVRFVARSTR